MRSTWRDSSYEVGWGMRPTPVVKWLLILNFAFFCLQGIFAFISNPMFQAFLQLSAAGVKQGCLWQFFTYMFLHAGPLHLIFNLLMLYVFGNEVEYEIGPRKFLQMYLLGGVVGGMLWFLFNFNNPVPMIGASGAIYAVIIAFGTLFPDRPITLLLFFVLPVTMLARYWAIVAVGISVVFLMSSDQDNVAHLAHLGGMAVGYLFIKALHHSWRMPRLNLTKTFDSSKNLRLVKRQPSESVLETDFISKKIDPILDKIAEHGINSLTREERKLLEEAKDRLP